MERILFWTLFAAGIVLAAWLPVTSAYPQFPQQLVHLVMRVVT